ncbi:MAG: RNase adapter RapZ [Syntrophomonadaceae bacterium]
MGEKSQGLHILIITGLSGAGKTQAINCLEDLGYYCVDNLPPVLMNKFIELGMQSGGRIEKVALVIDVRGGDFFADFTQALDELQQQGISYAILFLEASDDVLVRRFKESRRRHPLSEAGSLLQAIRLERSMLEDLRGRANVIIDTSDIAPRKLNEKLTSLFSYEKGEAFTINIISFGYKMGIPLDSDVIIDVRFLPNPFYDPRLRPLTGEDQEVIDYVLDSPTTQSFLRRFLNLLKFLIPHYVKEGKTNLALSIGCTGGQHRSVVLADYLARQFERMGYNTITRHRDVAKHKLEE